MKKLLHLNFLPRSTDLALLLLRLLVGGAMLWLHGRLKLTGFAELAPRFPDPFGVGNHASLALATLGEFVCAALIMVGAFTRVAALGVGTTMAVAFVTVHRGALSGPGNGELAFVFLAVFAALFLAGPGRYSVDAKMGARV